MPSRPRSADPPPYTRVVDARPRKRMLGNCVAFAKMAPATGNNARRRYASLFSISPSQKLFRLASSFFLVFCDRYCSAACNGETGTIGKAVTGLFMMLGNHFHKTAINRICHENRDLYRALGKHFYLSREKRCLPLRYIFLEITLAVNVYRINGEKGGHREMAGS